MNPKRNLQLGRYSSVYCTTKGCGGVVASDEGLIELFLPFTGDAPEKMVEVIAAAYPLAACGNALTEKAAALLEKYFAGEEVTFDLAIYRRGFTLFQQDVYALVVKIPFGQVKTYAQVAGEIGRPNAARGVGTAMARNPLPIIIPCHRVVGVSGAMTGYSGPGGVASKRVLLAMEGVMFNNGGRVNFSDMARNPF
jgi:methylated-DNA-[protein]-cysteine S-methyltransferase